MMRWLWYCPICGIHAGVDDTSPDFSRLWQGKYNDDGSLVEYTHVVRGLMHRLTAVESDHRLATMQ